MLKFSLNMLLTRLVNIFSGNLLTVYFGRNFPISVVGNFTQANKWETMGHSFLTGIVDQIAQPVLARISEDQEREKKVFRKMMRFMAFLSFPFMFGLSFIFMVLLFECRQLFLLKGWKDQAKTWL